jgi:hypothetical protein
MALLLLVDRRKAARVLLRDLREEFALNKDLEDIHYFIGIDATKTSGRIILT